VRAAFAPCRMSWLRAELSAKAAVVARVAAAMLEPATMPKRQPPTVPTT